VSDNAKLPEKRQDFLSLTRDTASQAPSVETDANGEPAYMQDVEAQMRRALGLFGGGVRKQEQERPAPSPAPRQTDRFAGGHAHKRRFVQDGEVPVTVLHARRDHPADAPQNRLEAVEAALNHERALREKAERALAEANATIHDIQTKFGHANLANAELQSAARRDHETIAALRAELREMSERTSAAETAQAKAEERVLLIEEEFAAEREARLELEHKLRMAEIARDSAEQLVRELDLDSNGPIDLPARRPGRPPKAAAEGKPRSARIRANRSADEPEPEPVQWWLMPAKKARRK
jgi:hypothetical protein